MSPLEIRFVRLPEAEAPAPLPLPEPQTEGAAGVDLRAALRAPLTIHPGGRARVPTGWCIALPEGTEGQIRPRSGMAWRKGLTCTNSPGTLDADYRGSVDVLLINHGGTPVTLLRGDRIAQLVVCTPTPICTAEVASLDETARGSGGFGHTGRQ